MPPRKTIEKAEIVKAAFEIVREAGWEALTARSLAKRLNISTMPLYSSLKSMEEIKDEIRKMASEVMFEYQRKPYTKEQLLNGALGYVTFAFEEKQLFRFLFMQEGQHRDVTGGWPNTGMVIPFIRDIDMEKSFPGIPEESIRRIIQNGWIFTHGLAMMVNSGIIPFEREEISRLLQENGMAQGAFIMMQEIRGK